MKKKVITIRHFDCAGTRNNEVPDPAGFSVRGGFLARDAAFPDDEELQIDDAVAIRAADASPASKGNTMDTARAFAKRASERSVARDAETAKRVASVQATNKHLWGESLSPPVQSTPSAGADFHFVDRNPARK